MTLWSPARGCAGGPGVGAGQTWGQTTLQRAGPGLDRQLLPSLGHKPPLSQRGETDLNRVTLAMLNSAWPPTCCLFLPSGGMRPADRRGRGPHPQGGTPPSRARLSRVRGGGLPLGALDAGAVVGAPLSASSVDIASPPTRVASQKGPGGRGHTHADEMGIQQCLRMTVGRPFF